MSILTDVLGGIVSPVTKYLGKREETKQTVKSLDTKIATKQLDNAAQVEFNEQEWEMIGKRAEGGTWKDEYITVSVVSIFNLILIGGLASAFGYPQVLDGLALSMTTMNDVGINLGQIMEVTIYAGLGIYILNKAK